MRASTYVIPLQSTLADRDESSTIKVLKLVVKHECVLGKKCVFENDKKN